jgi:dienelactone hydrolase
VQELTLDGDVAIAASSREGPQDLRARLYRPAPASAAVRWFSLLPRGLVLVPGVSFMGIDEPRLVAFAGALARAGIVVLTPELRSITEYKVDDPRNLQTMRAAVRYLARRRDLVRRGGVTLMGISFAGGLALRVAAEPGLEADLRGVIALGGHNDMARVARFFVTDSIDTPEGAVAWHAHDYGLAVLVFNETERFVSATDAPKLRAAVRAFLHEDYAAAAAAALAMSPDGRAVYDRVLHRDTHAFAAKVLAALPDQSERLRISS